MKLSSRRPTKASTQLVTAAMIDVVFLLLIFFMTTSNFLRQENEQLVTAQQPERGTIQDTPLEVLKIFVLSADNPNRYQIGERKIADREELVRFVELFGNQENGAIVQPERTADFRWTSAAIQVCRDAGYDPVTYETPP